MIGSQANKSLLGSIRTDQSVDLKSISVVKLLDGLLDLVLVSLDIDSQNQSVRLLNLLDSTLRVDVRDNDLVLIHARVVGNALSQVLGVTRQLEGLGATEGGRSSDLVHLVGVSAQGNGLLGLLGLCSRSFSGGHFYVVNEFPVSTFGQRSNCYDDCVPFDFSLPN